MRIHLLLFPFFMLFALSTVSAQQSMKVLQAVNVKYDGKLLKAGDKIELVTLLPRIITKHFFDENKLVFPIGSELYVTYIHKKEKKIKKWTYFDYENSPNGPVNYGSNVVSRLENSGHTLTYRCDDDIPDQLQLIKNLKYTKSIITNIDCFELYFSRPQYWLNGNDTVVLNFQHDFNELRFVGKDTIIFQEKDNMIIIEPRCLQETAYQIILPSKMLHRWRNRSRDNVSKTMIIDIVKEIDYLRTVEKYDDKQLEKCIFSNYIDPELHPYLNDFTIKPDKSEHIEKTGKVRMYDELVALIKLEIDQNGRRKKKKQGK